MKPYLTFSAYKCLYSDDVVLQKSEKAVVNINKNVRHTVVVNIGLYYGNLVFFQR